MERVCVYVDGSNLYHGLRMEHGRTDLDFARFIAWLVGPERRHIRTYYYSAPIDASRLPAQARAQQRFFARLQRIPRFEIRLGRLEPRGNTFVEKGVDVAIAVDMIEMGYRSLYDTAVLVSCDGDFVRAIHAIKGLGKTCEVACFARAFHVQQAADVVRRLDADSLDSLWL